MEVDFNINGDSYRPSVFSRQVEFPELDAFNGFLIQPHAERVHDLRVVDPAVRSDHNVQANHALILGFAGFFGKLGLRLVQDAGRAHAAFAQVKNPWAHARSTVTGPDSATVASTDAAAHAGSVGKRHQLGKGIADLALRNLEIGNHG